LYPGTESILHATILYDERPAWLAHAHAVLDRAVWTAYGCPDPPEETDDETILSRLLALNLERANAEGQRDDAGGGSTRVTPGT
jgi:hypothetical protein